MSFGFSVGDIIAAIELAKRVRKEFANAPGQFKAISDEVRSLSIILQDIDINLWDHELNDQQQIRLQEISSSCQTVLNELEQTARKYQELESRGGKLSTKAKRVWKRLNLEPEDIRELRDRITLNVLLLNTFLGGISSQKITEAKGGIDQLNRKQNIQERHNILDWLTTIDYAPNQSDFINQRAAGTGKWLIDSEQYQTWSEANIGIAYLYCDFRRQDEQKADDLLASLLKQLSQERASLPDGVKTLYEKHKKKRTRPSFDEISKTLQSVSAMFSKVFLIIDALDQCQTTNGCRTLFLERILAQDMSRANIFATSRFLPEITEQFNESISLEIRASEEDVRQYLDSCMFRLSACVSRSLHLQEEIKKAILLSVKGMFLLAYLHLKSLEGKNVPKVIRRALKELPSGSTAYDRAYQNTMERIEGQRPDEEELAKRVLSWITCAKRPLTTSELEYAIAVEPGEAQLDAENLCRVEDMVSVCAGLVIVDEESNIVRLVHYTTQEYFDRTKTSWFPDAEIEMAKTCVSYLLFNIFDAGVCSTDEDLDARLQKNPFYDYAARNWGYHAHMAPALIRMDTLMLQFLESELKVASASQAMLVPTNYPRHSQEVPRGVKGLHLAAYFNLQNVFAELLERGHDPEATDSNGQTPLMWAINTGHDTLVEILLTRDLRINAFDMLKRTALHHAASIGQIASMVLLMQHRADIEARDLQGQTPLLAAVSKGQMTAVKLLLDTGADQNAFDEKRKGALHLAIESDYISIEMVALLLRHGVSADMIDIDNMSPLHCTIQYRCSDIASLLLQNGVSIDLGIQRRIWTRRLRDESSIYELNYAPLVGDANMTKYFLSQSADPNALSYYRETPLHLSLSMTVQGVKYEDAWNEDRWRLEFLWDFVDFDDEYNREAAATQITDTRKAVVKALLSDDRTDVTLQDTQGSSILHAVNYRDLENPHIVRRLIQKGANPSARNLKGQTALHLASLAGHLQSVEILIAEGATIEMADNEGKTAIHYAAKSRNLQIMLLILGAYKGDVPDFLTLKENNGRSVLHHSVEDACSVEFDMIQMLLRLGASANNTDDLGNTPLAHYISQFHFSIDPGICQLLLEYGTNAESVNKAGKTLAELYATYGEVKVEVLQLFKEYNADMDKIDSEGMTLLHTIALRGSLTEEGLRFLLVNSNNHQNMKDSSGKTALQYAMEKANLKQHPDLFDHNRWARTAAILRMYAT